MGDAAPLQLRIILFSPYTQSLYMSLLNNKMVNITLSRNFYLPNKISSHNLTGNSKVVMNTNKEVILYIG